MTREGTPRRRGSAAGEETPARRRALYASLTLVGALVLVAVALEGAARFVDPRHGFAAWYTQSMTYLIDDEVDWVSEPRRYEWTRVDETFFRGPAVARAKPPGAFRIVALGGSSTFEIGKADDETWPSLLRRRLDERGESMHPIEVMNAATPGYSTWQSSRLLEKRVLDWQPDLVLVYHLANDSVYFRHTDREAVIEGWRLNARANYIGPMAHQPYAPLAWLEWATPRMTDLLRMRWVRRQIRGTRADAHTFWIDRTLSGHVEDAGLGFYEANLEAMARVLGERQIPFVIITQVSLLRADNSPEERDKITYEYRGLTHERLIEAYRRAWALNRDIAARHDHVYLIPAHEHIPATLEFLSDGVHLTATGSEALADFVAEQLTAFGLVR